MEILKNYRQVNDKYILTLENEGKEQRIVTEEFSNRFVFEEVQYLAIHSNNELFIYKFNIYCDTTKENKVLLLDISEERYEKVKAFYEEYIVNNDKVEDEITEDDMEETKNDIETILEMAKIKKPFKPSKGIFIILNVFLFVLLTFSIAYFNKNTMEQFGENKASTESTQENINTENIEIETSKPLENNDKTIYSVADIVEEVMPSVVSITSISKETLFNYFYGYYEDEVEGAGSGIIIGKNDTELLIATNSHVVVGSDDLKVYFNINGEDKEVSAQIKGTDEDSDLAIISIKLEKLDKEILDNIKIAVVGDSDKLRLGEPVIAIGNALGYGQSVTTGVVSAKDRMLEETGPYIQTDAAINPGNSGGALINAKGELIGINCAKLADTSIEGIGYAIPSSIFKPILEDLSALKTRDKVDEKDKGFIGITGTDVTKEVSDIYGMPVGVFVNSIVEGGGASKSLIQEKDIITKLDGKKIDSMTTLQATLDYYKVGEKVTVTIQRFVVDKYEEIDIEIVLSAKPKSE